jgi:hypothetical protein
LFFVAGCHKDDEKKVDEVPPDVIRTVANPILYPRIVELFPEYKHVNTLHPELFSDTVVKKIVLTGESEVYLTFIAEKAKYRNTVGWYSYPLGSEPASVSDVNIHLLFPNASAKDEGGELLQGDMLQLGETKFPKGTVIGFFLIIKGWQNGTIDYNGIANYTDFKLNAGGYQQHVLFKEKDSKDIVLGFEDMPFLEADQDYNDILFKVSDNKDGYESIYFDLNHVPAL